MNLCETCTSGVRRVHTPPYLRLPARRSRSTAATPAATGSSAISGLAFYPQSGGNYPTSYRNALFFADITRDCIFVVLPRHQRAARHDATRTNFVSGAVNPVDLQIGPNNDLFYVDYGGSGGSGTDPGTGAIRRVRYHAPTAIATANPTSGFAPLAVQLQRIDVHPGRARRHPDLRLGPRRRRRLRRLHRPEPQPHLQHHRQRSVTRLRVTDQDGRQRRERAHQHRGRLHHHAAQSGDRHPRRLAHLEGGRSRSASPVTPPTPRTAPSRPRA